MANAGIITVELNERALNRVLADVRSRCPAVAQATTRAAGLAVVGEIARSLNGEEAGYPVPKRIDTGRYRAAWNAGVTRATGLGVGSTPVTPKPNNRPEPGDGEGAMRSAGLFSSLYVRNNVRYGPYIEYGTKRMRPGGHLARALHVVKGQLPKIARALLKRHLGTRR